MATDLVTNYIDLRIVCSYIMKQYISYVVLILSIIAFLLVFIALATPAWQVVYAREIRQWIQSGLWMSCQTRPNGMYSCTYTFSHSDLSTYFSDEISGFRTPAFYPWQRNLFHAYLISQFFALLSFICFCVTVGNQHLALPRILKLVLLIIAVIISFGCLITFALYSYMVDYRFYHVSVSGIYEKHRGYSFYVALVGTIFYVIAIILSIIECFIGNRHSSSNSQQFINTSQQFEYFGQYQPPRSLDSYEDRFAMRSLPPLPIEKRTTYF